MQKSKSPKVSPDTSTNQVNPKVVDLQEKIRVQTRKVTNGKAGIFDIIEAKSIKQNEISTLQEVVRQQEQSILKAQSVLNGDRKVLADLKQQLEKETGDANNAS